MAQQPTGTCTTCGQELNLNRNDRVVNHNFNGQRCTGSQQEPYLVTLEDRIIWMERIIERGIPRDKICMIRAHETLDAFKRSKLNG